MATIEPYETKAGKRWAVRYRKPNRRQTMKRGFATKREAQAFANAVEVDKRQGAYVDPSRSRVTVFELGEAWVRRQSHVRPSSRRVYETAFRAHVIPAFGETPVGRVTAGSVRDWVADLSERRSARTVRRAHFVLRSILAAAVEDKVIPANPARGVRNLPPIPRPRKVYLNHAQVEALYEAVPERCRTAVYLAAYCGLRWGEIRALRAEDVDRERGIVIVERTWGSGGVGPPKSGAAREVGVPAFILDLLDGEGELFPDLTRAKNEAGTWWYASIRRAGLPEGFRFHDLRHAAASFAVSAGASVKVVQRMLGHASASMTLDVYSDLFEEDVRSASERIAAAREAALRGDCAQNVLTDAESDSSDE